MKNNKPGSRTGEKRQYFKKGGREGEGACAENWKKRLDVRENSKLQFPSKEILVKTGFHSGLGTGLLCFSFTLDRDGKDRKKLGVQLSESEGLFWSIFRICGFCIRGFSQMQMEYFQCTTHGYRGLAVRTLSIRGFWYPRGSWNQSLADTKGQQYKMPNLTQLLAIDTKGQVLCRDLWA